LEDLNLIELTGRRRSASGATPGDKLRNSTIFTESGDPREAQSSLQNVVATRLCRVDF
jgi:hypothetical protein